MLTARQAQLLDFIRRYMAESGGVAPSCEEMTAALELASKSNVHRILGELEDRGHIRRLPHRTRAIEVVEPLPADLRHTLRETLQDARNVISDRASLTAEGRAVRLDRIDRLMERLQR